MPYINEPGVLGNLTQGLQTGLGLGMSLADREAKRKQIEHENAMQMIQQLTLAAQGGAPVNDQLAAAYKAAGVQGVTPDETPNQLRARILAANPLTNASTQMTPSVIGPPPKTPMAYDAQGNPVMGPQQVTSAPQVNNPVTTLKQPWERFSNDQLATAGLQTRAQRAADEAAIGTSALTGQTNKLKSDVLNGKTVDPFAAEVVLGTTPEKFQLDMQNARVKAVMDRAPSYVDNVVNSLGKPVTRQNVGDIAGAAYAQWLKAEGATAPPDLKTDAKAYFADTARQRFVQDEDLRLKQEQIALQNKALNPTKETPVQILNSLTTMAKDRVDWMRTKYGTKYDQMSMLMAGLQNGTSNLNDVMTQNPRMKEFLSDQQTVDQTQTMIGQVAGQLFGGQTGGAMTGGVPGFGVPRQPSDATETPFQKFAKGKPKDRQGRIGVSAQDAASMKRLGTWDDTKFYMVK